MDTTRDMTQQLSSLPKDVQFYVKRWERAARKLLEVSKQQEQRPSEPLISNGVNLKKLASLTAYSCYMDAVRFVPQPTLDQIREQLQELSQQGHILEP